MWEVSTQLLRSNDQGVRYFAANIILLKVRRCWHLLEYGQKVELCKVVEKNLEESYLVAADNVCFYCFQIFLY